MDNKNNIIVSAEFPYESKFVKVNGAKIHYIDEGTGDPILFLHGVPTSCYLWRNIIPELKSLGRCIAPDLIGMGKSDKPDIQYNIFDHINYIQEFIKALDLKRVTLVLHGWGSVIGFHYAMENQKNIKAIAFYESYLHLDERDMLSLPVQQLATMLKNRQASYKAIVEGNYFIEKLLPANVLRTLTVEELAHYREPFATASSRKPLWQYVQELPLINAQGDVVKLIENYADALQRSEIPKLLLYTIPGFITTVSTIKWCRQHLPNLQLADLGECLHFVQETNPELFRKALAQWYKEL